MRIRRLSKTKIYIYFSLLFMAIFISYTEEFSYYFNTLNWYKLSCANKNSCVKILLVADPQIIGNNKEILHFLTPVSIFDSDRYLKKTYAHAYNFVDPDLVIFLGDLMDEAHIATNEEFYEYVRRLFDIFLDNQNYHKFVSHIWLPGDNDIGGEDSVVTPEKLKRFQTAFDQPDIISYKNVTFFKVNRLTSTVPIYKEEREFYNTNQIFVGLSHVPLMFKPSTFVDKVIRKMLPHLLFTAHEHKSMIISTDALMSQEFHIVPITPDNNQVFEYSLGISDRYEILLPTCSYRMGTDKIGYGYAILENTDLRFTVLWSPSRFHQLGNYLVFFVILFICTILIKCC